ncbi:metallophosphoesterase [Pedobacter rhizosphaerae]|uniref:Calcineurin-like phosphoesterase n=1 Tax=Pedobacter rhizosphaerae TaxID=390241 RepID=A0A1H9T4D3_9SPHI|nr:metallophosphoesterase [Pedobacter rhizosphaerae]SER91443.1 Calcineurin-like phosphoesterase [Pedobacter rhizosphaerae]
MNIQYASDLHLEFPENREYLRKNPILASGEILILAGDIIPFGLIDRGREFFDKISADFKEVYWVPGNHEYYYDDITDHYGVLHEQIRENVYLVNNVWIEKDGCELIFSTMWSNISAQNQWRIANGMADFQVIKYNGQAFSPAHFNKLHFQSLEFLSRALSRVKRKTRIVATHHVPTLINYPPKYKGDILTEAFAVELADFIAANSPDYWISGHHHYNHGGFNIVDTQMLTNQLGYVRYGEQLGYRDDAFIDLG